MFSCQSNPAAVILLLHVYSKLPLAPGTADLLRPDVVDSRMH